MTAGRKDHNAPPEPGLPLTLPDDLGEFLFAEIGAEPGGLPLTALSTLARLGFDPWEEAGRLSKLPSQQAAAEFARSLALVHPAPNFDAGGAAERLVALLPGPSTPRRVAARLATPGILAAIRRWVALAVVGTVLLGLAGHSLARSAPDPAGGTLPKAGQH